MMNLVSDKLIEVLAGPPSSILTANSMGVKKPANGSEVPAIVISLTFDDQKRNGSGRMIRPADALHDEILGISYTGVIALEIWATSFPETDTLARQLQMKLKANRALCREKGFFKLHPASLGPIEQVQHAPVSGSSFPVWQQQLAYRFAFEAEEVGEPSGGGLIKRIDVDMDESIVESFSVS